MPHARRPRKDDSSSPDQPLRAGIYARVSTEEQAAEGHSIDAQLRLTREFAERRGWVVTQEYTDPGYSGTNDKRPAFKRLVADALAGDIQVVAFHKLDRFSRSISDILKYFRDLEAHGVLMASATEPFDFTTPHGKAHFHMLAVFAQWYIDNLSAETKKGKKQRALEGLHNGRLPFGYVKSESGVGKVVPEEEKVIREAYEAYATGNYTDRQIAELVNATGLRTRTGRRWSKDSTRDFLRNEFYYGVVKYRGDTLPGKHKAIISKELFELCQQVRASHRRAPRSHTPNFRTYVLSQVIRCDRCGRKLRAQSSRGYRYYRELSNRRGLRCKDSGSTIKAEDVEEEIGTIFCNLRLPESWQDNIREAVMSEDERLQMVERKQFLEGKLSRLGIAFADGAIEKSLYDREKGAVEAELATLIIPEQIEVIDAGLYLETLHTLWKDATLEEQRDICRLMLESVYYDFEQEHIVGLKPKPTFLPLFREADLLEEGERRRFSVLSAAWQDVEEKSKE